MSYQALYRKYRSQRFDEMVGQEVVATTLKNAIVNNQISHAYLFSGPRGTGKTSAAKIFAKAINCLHPENGEPDNTCEICQAINNGSLEDVIELDAASNNGVDEIREIRDKSTYAASLAHYKVYIIDEVHMLSTGAFNALLKTLEEPTPDVVFILATTELQKVPATIISRVQRFAFKSISTKDIREHLADVLHDENLDYEDAALDVLARAAEGGMRDALSLLDQALSFSENKLKLSDALLVTGAISEEALVQYVQAIANDDVKSALTELDKIFAEGKNMSRFAEDLLAYFRDLLFAAETDIPHARLYQWIDIVIDSLKTLRETTQSKIVADVMTMQLTEKPSMASVGAPAGNNGKEELEIQRLEKQVETLQKKLAVDSQVENTSPSIAASSQVEPVDAPLERSSQAEAISIPLPPEPEVATPLVPDMVETASATPEPQAAAAIEAPVSASKPKPANVNAEAAPELVLTALDEAVNEPDVIEQVKSVWSELTTDFNAKATALLGAMKPIASSSKHLLLTVEPGSLKSIILKDDNLLTDLANKLSLLTGLSPQIILLTPEEWLQRRQEYTQQRRKEETAPVSPTAAEEADLPEDPQTQEIEIAKQLFGDKAQFIED